VAASPLSVCAGYDPLRPRRRYETFLADTGLKSLKEASIVGTMTHVLVQPRAGYAWHSAYEGEPLVNWFKGLGLDASVFRYPYVCETPHRCMPPKRGSGGCKTVRSPEWA
jgi:hypothetical protein